MAELVCTKDPKSCTHSLFCEKYSEGSEEMQRWIECAEHFRERGVWKSKKLKNCTYGKGDWWADQG